MRELIAIVVLVVIFLSGVYVGRAGIEKQVAQATGAQLKTDAAAVKEIKGTDDEKKVKVNKQVARVHEQAPDWAAVPLPAVVIDGLQHSGIRTGSGPIEGLR